jgi:hypothetical protein
VLIVGGAARFVHIPGGHLIVSHPASVRPTWRCNDLCPERDQGRCCDAQDLCVQWCCDHGMLERVPRCLVSCPAMVRRLPDLQIAMRKSP